MKVGSDAIILSMLSPKGIEPKNILDIGCGCGIITLSMADTYPNANIIGIDIDNESIIEAGANFEASIFADRLRAKSISLKEFASNSKKEFDLIVSNPPFFINSLESKDPRRNKARHSSSLSYEELIAVSSKLLSPQGILSIIIPFQNKEVLERIAIENGLVAIQRYHILSRPKEEPIRILFHFSKQGLRSSSHKEITIRNSDNSLNDSFKLLSSRFLVYN